MKAFARWRGSRRADAPPSEPLTAAIRYYDKHGDALFRFVDATPKSRSITRPPSANFKTSRSFGSTCSSPAVPKAPTACVLLQDCRHLPSLRVPIEAYLAWAFERLGTHRDVFGLPLDALTPAAFKESARLGRRGDAHPSTPQAYPHPGVADGSRLLQATSRYPIPSSGSPSSGQTSVGADPGLDRSA